MILINEKTGHCELEGTDIDLLGNLILAAHMLVTDTDLTASDIMVAVVTGLEFKEEEEN